MDEHDDDMVVGHIPMMQDEIGEGFPMSMFGPVGPVTRKTRIQIPRAAEQEPAYVVVESEMQPDGSTETVATIEGTLDPSECALAADLIAGMFHN